MKIGDIYKHKETNSLIRIECFASLMGRFESGKCIIVFSHIEKNEFGVGSCPSFNGYGSVEEIEREYELLVSQEKLSDCASWDEFFKLVKEG